MRRTLLVAGHEFVKFITRRGFLIGLVLLPAWIFIASALPRWIAQAAPPRVFAVIDHAGGYDEALASAARAETDDAALAALVVYSRTQVDMKRLAASDPDLAHLLSGRQSEHSATDQIEAMRGPAAIVQRIARYRKADAPPPLLPAPRVIHVPVPAGLSDVPDASFAARAQPFLEEGKGLDAIIVVPKDFGTGTTESAMWTSGPNRPELRDFVQHTLTDALRQSALKRAAPTASASLLDVSADLRGFDPAGNGAAHSLSFADQARRYAPSGLAFILVLTIFMNAAALMSAVIEEKSNRVVEVMLSCVSPREFMTGKLLGAAGASLFTLFVWVGFAGLAAWLFLPGGPLVIASVAAAIASGAMLPMLVLCFTCGLLIYASIFLAIGSLANSVQDAQAFVGPTMIIVIAPMIVMPALLSDPNGALATALTWIPVYTPFFMMFRLPWHPPAVQVVLATILMIVTAGFMVTQMARIFAANVLSSERPPKFGVFLRSLVGLGPKERVRAK